MTIEQANAYFASLPEGFAPARQLQEALSAKAGRVDYLGVAGTAGKTTAAALTAAVLRAAGLVTGSYHAGCEPLSARIRVNGEPVAPELLAQAAETLSARETLPRAAAERAAAARCFGEAGCALAVVELPDAGLAEALPKMPVCAVTSIGPDGISASLERSAALAAGVMRKGSICVTAPEQPKAVVSELIVAAGKADCELVVPDPDDITFLEAEKFASRVDYGGYTVPLAFLGRHAAGNAAVAVERAAEQIVRRDVIVVARLLHKGEARLADAVFIVAQKRLRDAEVGSRLALGDLFLLPQQGQGARKISVHARFSSSFLQIAITARRV